jgi:hypothetical protein
MSSWDGLNSSALSQPRLAIDHLEADLFSAARPLKVTRAAIAAVVGMSPAEAESRYHTALMRGT